MAKLVTRRIGKFTIARVNGQIQITRDNCAGILPAKSWAEAIAYAQEQSEPFKRWRPGTVETVSER